MPQEVHSQVRWIARAWASRPSSRARCAESGAKDIQLPRLRKVAARRNVKTGRPAWKRAHPPVGKMWLGEAALLSQGPPGGRPNGQASGQVRSLDRELAFHGIREG